MARSPGRAGHRWRQLVAQVRAEEFACAWCGRDFDPEARYPDPWSTSVDHIVALELGGDPLDRQNVCAMHLDCNNRKGLRPLSDRPRPSVYVEPSRDWFGLG